LSQKKFIILETPYTFQKIIKCLNKWGVALLPEFTNKDHLDHLITEFHFILNNEFKGKTSLSMNFGKAAKIIPHQLDVTYLPKTTSFFNNPLMKELVYSFLGKKSNFNEEIYVMKEIVGTNHVAHQLHFDVTRTFKFMVYLKDTTSLNGAFVCFPGSQNIAKGIRKKYKKMINYENLLPTRDLPYTKNDLITLEGLAGSLIIFDTNIFHQGGVVNKGERWIMRSHNRLKKAKYNIFKRIILKLKDALKKKCCP